MLADGLFNNIEGFQRALRFYPAWQIALELFLIGAVVFWVIRFLQGTRGQRLLKGIVLVLIGLYIVVSLLRNSGFGVIAFLYDKLLLVASAAIVVVFQPELRRALMRLGETRFFRPSLIQIDHDVDELVQSAIYNSKRKVGMLVAIEREVGLGGFAEGAVKIDAELSSSLLNTIFFPDTPLHDLGVVVSNGRVAYAGVQFPLADAGELERELGSRHRAAVGMSQETDAVVLVVSEETGDISIAERGVLIRKLTPEALSDFLGEMLGGTGVPMKPKDDDPGATREAA
ncbi:MAG: diadenylate cyclase CdaA [Tepidisphaeraceae bacterium]